jgi:hypothetical protein
LGLFNRNQTSTYIFSHKCILAVSSITIAAAAGQAQPEALAVFDQLPSFAAQFSAIGQLNMTCGTCPADIAAALWILDTIKHCIEKEIISLAWLNLDYLAKPATQCASTTRAFA